MSSSMEHPHPAYRATLVAAALATGCLGAAAARADAHGWYAGQEARWQGRSDRRDADGRRGRASPGTASGWLAASGR
jgi:hypothetical protein